MDSFFLPRGMIPRTTGKPNEVIYNPKPGVRGTNQYTSFSARGYTHEQAIAFLTDNLMTDIKVLEDGSYCGMYKLAYTWSICTDVGPQSSYTYRWCFEDRDEALQFLEELTEFDQTPDFDKYKSIRGHRFNSEARVIQHDEMGVRKW